MVSPTLVAASSDSPYISIVSATWVGQLLCLYVIHRRDIAVHVGSREAAALASVNDDDDRHQSGMTGITTAAAASESPHLVRLGQIDAPTLSLYDPLRVPERLDTGFELVYIFIHPWTGQVMEKVRAGPAPPLDVNGYPTMSPADVSQQSQQSTSPEVAAAVAALNNAKAAAATASATLTAAINASNNSPEDSSLMLLVDQATIAEKAALALVASTSATASKLESEAAASLSAAAVGRAMLEAVGASKLPHVVPSPSILYSNLNNLDAKSNNNNSSSTAATQKTLVVPWGAVCLLNDPRVLGDGDVFNTNVEGGEENGDSHNQQYDDEKDDEGFFNKMGAENEDFEGEDDAANASSSNSADAFGVSKSKSSPTSYRTQANKVSVDSYNNRSSLRSIHKELDDKDALDRHLPIEFSSSSSSSSSSSALVSAIDINRGNVNSYGDRSRRFSSWGGDIAFDYQGDDEEEVEVETLVERALRVVPTEKNRNGKTSSSTSEAITNDKTRNSESNNSYSHYNRSLFSNYGRPGYTLEHPPSNRKRKNRGIILAATVQDVFVNPLPNSSSSLSTETSSSSTTTVSLSAAGVALCGDGSPLCLGDSDLVRIPFPAATNQLCASASFPYVLSATSNGICVFNTRTCEVAQTVRPAFSGPIAFATCASEMSDRRRFISGNMMVNTSTTATLSTSVAAGKDGEVTLSSIRKAQRQQLRQTVSQPERVFAYSSSGILCLRMLPAVMQVAALLSLRPPRFEAALSLCDTFHRLRLLLGLPATAQQEAAVSSSSSSSTIENDEAERRSMLDALGGVTEEKIQLIRSQFGYTLFSQGDFAAGLAHLARAREPVRKVLALYPQVAPQAAALSTRSRNILGLVTNGAAQSSIGGNSASIRGIRRKSHQREARGVSGTGGVSVPPMTDEMLPASLPPLVAYLCVLRRRRARAALRLLQLRKRSESVSSEGSGAGGAGGGGGGGGGVAAGSGGIEVIDEDEDEDEDDEDDDDLENDVRGGRGSSIDDSRYDGGVDVDSNIGGTAHYMISGGLQQLNSRSQISSPMHRSARGSDSQHGAMSPISAGGGLDSAANNSAPSVAFSVLERESRRQASASINALVDGTLLAACLWLERHYMIVLRKLANNADNGNIGSLYAQDQDSSSSSTATTSGVPPSMYSTDYDVQNLVLQLKRVRRRIRALLSSTSQMPPSHATLASVSSYSAGSALDLASASQQLEAFGKGLSSDMVSLYWAHSRHDAALAVLAKVADVALKASVREGLSSLLFRPHWLSLSALEELLPVTQRLRSLSCYLRPLGAGNEALVEMYVKPLLEGAAGAVGVLFGLQTLLPPSGLNGYASSSSSSSSGSTASHNKKQSFDFVPLSPTTVFKCLRDEVKYTFNHPQFWTLTGWRKHPDDNSSSVESSSSSGNDFNMRSKNRSTRAPLLDLILTDGKGSKSSSSSSSSHTMDINDNVEEGGKNDPVNKDVSSLLSQLLSSEPEQQQHQEDDHEDTIIADDDDDEKKKRKLPTESQRCDLLSTEIEQFSPPSGGWSRHFAIVFLEGKLRMLYSIVNNERSAAATLLSSRQEHDDVNLKGHKPLTLAKMMMMMPSFSDVLSTTASAEVELRQGVKRISTSLSSSLTTTTSSSSINDPPRLFIESLAWVARPLLQSYLESMDEICTMRGITVAFQLINESSALLRNYRYRIRLLILFMSLSSFYSAREALSQLRSSPSGQRLLEERSLVLRLMGAHAEAMELLVHRLGDHAGAETYCRLAVEHSDALYDQRELQSQSQSQSQQLLNNQGLGGKISEAFTDLLKAYVTSSSSPTKTKTASVDDDSMSHRRRQSSSFDTVIGTNGGTAQQVNNEKPLDQANLKTLLLRPRRSSSQRRDANPTAVVRLANVKDSSTSVIDDQETINSMEKVVKLTEKNDEGNGLESSSSSSPSSSSSSSSSREGLDAVVGILARNTSKVRTSTALQLLPYSFPLSQAEPFLLACMRQTTDSARTLSAAHSLASVYQKQQSIGLISRQARAVVIEKASLCAHCGRKFATSNSRTMTSTVAGAIAVYPDGRVVHSACLHLDDDNDEE